MSNDTEQNNESDQSVTEFDLTTENSVEASFPSWIKWLAIISFLGILALAAAVYYIYSHGHQQLAALKTDIESQVQSNIDNNLADVEQLETQLKQKLESTTANEEKQQSAIEELQTNQTAIQETLTALNQERPDSNLDWSLAEIENLIVIALQRLQLANDPQTAITALETADLRLKDLSDPSLLTIRQQLTTDINKLKAVNKVDTSGMSLYLSDLISKVDNLPLKDNSVLTKTDTSTNSEATSSENKTWQQNLLSLPGLVWQELKSNLVIKHKDELDGSNAFLLPEQEYYLYQNLRLQLQNAKFAVLTQDTKNLHASVDTITAWLEQHFKSNDAAVINIIEALSKMKSVELKPEMPDISSSLETLRAVIRNNQSDNN